MSEHVEEQTDGLEGLDEALGLEPEAEAEEAQPSEPETGEAEPEAQPEELILGRFKTADDLAKSYQELEREFGARNKDWQELKQLREEFSGFREQQAQQAYEQQVAATAPQLVSQYMDAGDYHSAANVAAGVPDGGLLYGQVAGLWHQDDPQSFNSYQMLLQQQQMLAQMQEQAAAVQAAQAETQMQQAFTEFAQGKPDLHSVAPAMLTVAEESPKILALLQDPDPSTRVEVLDYLYEKAQKRVAGVVTSAAQRSVEESSLEAAVARQGAAQPSPTGRVEAEASTPEDEWLAEFDKAAAKYYG